MKTKDETVKGPFHETIIDVIRRASIEEMWCLGTLIMTTKIPKNHNKIIAALEKKWPELARHAYAKREIAKLKRSLLEQKAASERTGDGKKGINLDDLEQEAEKLLILLKDRQPDLMTWEGFFLDRLQNIHKLTSQALGK